MRPRISSIVLTLAVLTTVGIGSANPQITGKGSAQKGPTRIVAFSFSARCLRDLCGDGAWGADIEESNTQLAIDRARNKCESQTGRRGMCRSGIRYFVQCDEGKEKWAALAIYDDRQEHLYDGESIDSDTKEHARQAAVSKCGQKECLAVWSAQVCKGDSSLQRGGQ
jgi:hypothetical protein